MLPTTDMDKVNNFLRPMSIYSLSVNVSLNDKILHFPLSISMSIFRCISNGDIYMTSWCQCHSFACLQWQGNILSDDLQFSTVMSVFPECKSNFNCLSTAPKSQCQYHSQWYCPCLPHTQCISWAMLKEKAGLLMKNGTTMAEWWYMSSLTIE